MLTRREVSLLIFCLAIYILFYNADSSSSNTYAAIDLVGNDGIIAPDGRRLPQYADDLEREIFGAWEPEKAPKRRPDTLVSDAWQKWAPSTLVAHVPGFTVIDNAIIAHGIVFAVSDSPESYPDRGQIMSNPTNPEHYPRADDVQIITTKEARERFGELASRIEGVTWLASGPAKAHDAQTLLATFRLHTATDSKGFPARLILPHIEYQNITKAPIDTALIKAVFPSIGFMGQEWWSDYHNTLTPFVFKRLIITDRFASKRDQEKWSWDNHYSKQTVSDGKSVVKLSDGDKQYAYTYPFAIPAPEGWWDPIIENALAFAGVEAVPTGPIKAVTYISTQKRAQGPKLAHGDHNKLVEALTKLVSLKPGWKLNIIDLHDDSSKGTPVAQRIKVAAQSSIMLGVFGDALASYSIFMPNPAHSHKSESKKPGFGKFGGRAGGSGGTNGKTIAAGGPPVIIEFFTHGFWGPSTEFIARAMGYGYMGSWSDRTFTQASLPDVRVPYRTDVLVGVDVRSVITAVKNSMG